MDFNAKKLKFFGVPAELGSQIVNQNLLRIINFHNLLPKVLGLIIKYLYNFDSPYLGSQIL